MATIQSILNRIGEMGSRIGKNSIGKNDFFGLLTDIVKRQQSTELNMSNLSLRKIYASIAAMEADVAAPVGDDGEKILKGQLVVISAVGVDMGKVYRYSGTAWEYAGQIGDLSQKADKTEIGSLANTPFTINNPALVGILDIKIFANNDSYTKYSIEYFWRNVAGTWLIRLRGWTGDTWVTVYNWDNPGGYVPASNIEKIKFGTLAELIIDWRLVPDGNNFSGVAEIKKRCYNLSNIKEEANFSFDVFPVDAPMTLRGVTFAKVIGNTDKNRIFFIELIETNPDYRRIWAGHCNADGTGYERKFQSTVFAANFVDQQTLEIAYNELTLVLTIDWDKMGNQAGTYNTTNFLKSVYYPEPVVIDTKGYNYDVFPVTVPLNLRGITFAKVIGNTDKNRIFFVEQIENDVEFRRFWIGYCNADGTGYVRQFNHIIWAAEGFEDEQTLVIKAGELTLHIHVKWPLITTFGGGAYNTTNFLKSVYYPESNINANNSGYINKDNTTNIVSVDCLGNGDFSTIQAAYESITDSVINNQYEVVVFPGEYNEVNLKPPTFTHTHGLAPNTVIVTSKGKGGTLPVFDQQNGSSKLSNMKIISDTGYCIHYDVGLHSEVIMNENLHLKKNTYDAIIGGGSFLKGTVFYWKNITFENGIVPCHTNVNQNFENIHLVYDNCKLINARLSLGSVGGYGHCVCEIKGLYTPKGEISLQNWNSPLRSINQPNTYLGNNVEWQIIGGGNTNFLPAIGSTGEALEFEADNVGENILLGGSALPLLFGIVKYKKGGSRLKGKATGIYHVKDEQAGLVPYSVPDDVFQMWKRLGNCAAVNKTLTVTIGGTTQTYTFNQDYLTLKTNEAAIIAAINGVITIATLKKLVAPSTWENINTTEKQFVIVADESDILSGEFVTSDGFICPENSTKDQVFGVALESGAIGEQIQVWIGNVINIVGVDGEYGIGNDGKLSIASPVKIGQIKNNVFLRY